MNDHLVEPNCIRGEDSGRKKSIYIGGDGMVLYENDGGMISDSYSSDDVNNNNTNNNGFCDKSFGQSPTVTIRSTKKMGNNSNSSLLSTHLNGLTHVSSSSDFSLAQVSVSPASQPDLNHHTPGGFHSNPKVMVSFLPTSSSHSHLSYTNDDGEDDTDANSFAPSIHTSENHYLPHITNSPTTERDMDDDDSSTVVSASSASSTSSPASRSFKQSSTAVVTSAVRKPNQQQEKHDTAGPGEESNSDFSQSSVAASVSSATSELVVDEDELMESEHPVSELESSSSSYAHVQCKEDITPTTIANTNKINSSVSVTVTTKTRNLDQVKNEVLNNQQLRTLVTETANVPISTTQPPSSSPLIPYSTASPTAPVSTPTAPVSTGSSSHHLPHSQSGKAFTGNSSHSWKSNNNNSSHSNDTSGNGPVGRNTSTRSTQSRSGSSDHAASSVRSINESSGMIGSGNGSGIMGYGGGTGYESCSSFASSNRQMYAGNEGLADAPAHAPQQSYPSSLDQQPGHLYASLSDLHAKANPNNGMHQQHFLMPAQPYAMHPYQMQMLQQQQQHQHYHLQPPPPQSPYKHKSGRRASLGVLPTPSSLGIDQFDDSNFDAEHHMRAGMGQRAASVPPQVDDGYGTDDDRQGSNHTYKKQSKVRVSRRSSLAGGANVPVIPGSSNIIPPGYIGQYPIPHHPSFEYQDHYGNQYHQQHQMHPHGQAMMYGQPHDHIQQQIHYQYQLQQQSQMNYHMHMQWQQAQQHQQYQQYPQHNQQLHSTHPLEPTASHRSTIQNRNDAYSSSDLVGNGVMPTSEFPATTVTPKVDGMELVDEGVYTFNDSKGKSSPDVQELPAVIVYPGDRDDQAVYTKQTEQSKRVPARRGVARQPTGDSMLLAMQVDDGSESDKEEETLIECDTKEDPNDGKSRPARIINRRGVGRQDTGDLFPFFSEKGQPSSLPQRPARRGMKRADNTTDNPNEILENASAPVKMEVHTHLGVDDSDITEFNNSKDRDMQSYVVKQGQAHNDTGCVTSDSAQDSATPSIEEGENMCPPSISRKGGALRTRRGVVRQQTGDSVELNILANAACSRDRTKRSGQRRMVKESAEPSDHVSPPTEWSETALPSASEVPHNLDLSASETEKNATEKESLTGSVEIRANKAPPRRRVIDRQPTGDSMMFAQIAINGGEDNARRGRRTKKSEVAVNPDQVEVIVDSEPVAPDEPKQRMVRDGGIRSRRGVVRQDTGDSITLMDMITAKVDTNSNDPPIGKTRRGGRRQGNVENVADEEKAQNDGPTISGNQSDTNQEKEATDGESHPVVGSTDMETKVEIENEGRSRTVAGKLTNRRGVARQDTGDSVTLYDLASTLTKGSGGERRRGGRRRDSAEVPQMDDEVMDNSTSDKKNSEDNGITTQYMANNIQPQKRVGQEDSNLNIIEINNLTNFSSIENPEAISSCHQSESEKFTCTNKMDENPSVILSEEEAAGLGSENDTKTKKQDNRNESSNVSITQGSIEVTSNLSSPHPSDDNNDYEYEQASNRNQYFHGAHSLAPVAYSMYGPHTFHPAAAMAPVMHLPMPYMHLQLPPPRAQRRMSNASASSRASARSRRRNSYVGVREKPLLLTKSRMCSDSEMESSDSETQPDRVLGILPPKQMYGFRKDAREIEGHSDAESAYSISSSKRARRRNSCLEYGGSDPFYASGNMSGAKLSAKASDSEQDDDPDSLFNRAKAGLVNKNQHSKPYKPNNNNDQQHQREEDDDTALLFDPQPQAVINRQLNVNSAASTKQMINIDSSSSSIVNKKKDSWRSAPLTTPYLAPTVENMKEDPVIKTEIATMNSIRGNWGDMQFHSKADTNSRTESTGSSVYGASLYEDKHVSPEIDRYKQRARRRASIETSCIDIENIITKLDVKIIPSVKPAEGCRNASDFIVRCFTARLRTTGFTVLKHNRRRWSKSQYRVIYLQPDGKSLSWKLVDGEDEKSKGKAKRPEVDLSKCKEIRHAWTKDPGTRKKTGTAVMRSRCKEDDAARSFSLVFSKRTLDVTAYSIDQCKVLMEGFSALCFRLQLENLKKIDSAPEVDDSQGTIAKEIQSSDDDWASTVYGVESIATRSITSYTQKNLQTESSPWGV